MRVQYEDFEYLLKSSNDPEALEGLYSSDSEYVFDDDFDYHAEFYDIDDDYFER